VRLPFEIYWAASLSVTLFLGIRMYIWPIIKNPDDWPRTAKVITRLGAGRLFEWAAKKRPGSNDNKPSQSSVNKGDGDVIIIESSRDAPLAANSQPTSTLGQIMAGHPPQTVEPKKSSTPDLEAQEAAVGSADTVNENERPSRCAIM
jgi:hypothetical protein